MPLTRFAPAPTGALHLGHVVNAIFVWGLGRALGARVILRIEDHDRQRSRPAYERGILDDLDWLGFAPDLFPTSDFRRGPCPSRQSDRHAIYASHAARLIDAGRVYGCSCSRQQLGQVASASTPLGYPGTCRNRGIALSEDVAWRVTLDDIPTDPFEDLLGSVPTDSPFGDPVVRDRRGQWTYQFAVTVDDFEQGVDLVIRGQDLLDSTPLQVRLGRLIGRPRPARFAHHPLVMKSPTAKLSKSDGDSGVSDLRKAGWTPERVIGKAAHLAGLAPSGGSLGAHELTRLFERDRC